MTSIESLLNSENITRQFQHILNRDIGTDPKHMSKIDVMIQGLTTQLTTEHNINPSSILELQLGITDKIHKMIYTPRIIEALSLTHVDIGILISYIIGRDYICTGPKMNQWFRFKDGLWCDINLLQLITYIEPLINSVLVKFRTEQYLLYDTSHDDLQRSILGDRIRLCGKLMNELEKSTFMKNCLESCRHLLHDINFSSTLNTQQYAIPVSNGMIEFDRTTGNVNLRQYTHEDKFTKSIPYSYRRDGPTGLALKYLSSFCYKVEMINETEFKLYSASLIGEGKVNVGNGYITIGDYTYTPCQFDMDKNPTFYFKTEPDYNKIKLILQIIGVALIGKNVTRTLPIIYGPNDTGMSFIYNEVLSPLFGKFYDIDYFHAFYSGSSKYDKYLSSLPGKRLVMITDGPTKKTLSDVQVERLTEVNPVCIIMSNDKIRVNSTRSVVHIPLKTTFTSRVDPTNPYSRRANWDMTEYRTSEFYTQLLTLAVEGARQVIANGNRYDNIN